MHESPLRQDAVAWKWIQLGVLCGEGTWERGQLEAVFGQLARRNLGQMATRDGS